MLQREAEQAALVLPLHGGRGGRDSNARQADHLAHHTTRGVAGGHQDRIHSEFVGGHFLECAEKRISRSVASREKHAQRSQNGTE